MNVLAKIALEQSHIERMGSCIESLETLVRNGTERQKGHAANALGNIACNDNMRKNMRSCIRSLETLVRSGTEWQKDKATYALACLAFANNWILRVPRHLPPTH